MGKVGSHGGGMGDGMGEANGLAAQTSAFNNAWQTGGGSTPAMMAATTINRDGISIAISISISVGAQARAAGQQAQQVADHVCGCNHTRTQPFEAAQDAMGTVMDRLASLMQDLRDTLGGNGGGDGDANALNTQMQGMMTLIETLGTLMQRLQQNAFQGKQPQTQPNAGGLQAALGQLRDLMQMLPQIEAGMGRVQQQGNQNDGAMGAEPMAGGADHMTQHQMAALHQSFDMIQKATAQIDMKMHAGCGQNAQAAPLDPVAVNNGRIWGDPHFIGADGGKFDVQGQDGKIYNLLSDEGIQVNARFDGAGTSAEGKEITYLGEVGMTLGTHQVAFDKHGKLTIDGKDAGQGEHLGGMIRLEGDKLFVKEQEYSFELHSIGTYMNMENIRSDNAAADGVMPTGLWGGTVDGDGQARNGDKGAGKQGGGAIETLDGGIAEKGDLNTVKTYEVGGLFDSDFANHNSFQSAAPMNGAEQAGQFGMIGAQMWGQHMAWANIGMHIDVDVTFDGGQQHVLYPGHAPIEAKIEGAETLTEGGWNTRESNGNQLDELQQKDVNVTGRNAEDYHIALSEPASRTRS